MERSDAFEEGGDLRAAGAAAGAGAGGGADLLEGVAVGGGFFEGAEADLVAGADEWAIDWVRYQTGGAGDFVTTAMEDTGTLQSLTLLAKAGRADLRRVLVLRTASNFDMPPPGVTAADNLARLKLGAYSAFLPALEAAWKVGNTVVANLVANWAKYRDTTPAGRQ